MDDVVTAETAVHRHLFVSSFMSNQSVWGQVLSGPVGPVSDRGVRCLILPWLGVSLLDGDKTRFSFMLLLQPHALACVVHLRSRKLQFSDNFPIEITEYLLLSSKSCKSDLQGCKSSYFLLFPYSSDLYNRDSSYFALKFIYYVNSRTRSTIQIE